MAQPVPPHQQSPLQPPPMPPQTLAYASPPMGAVGAAWRQGNQLVTPREVDLGDVCVKCGAPAEGWRWNKTLYWISSVYILLIFVPFGLIILLIVYLAARKSAKVSAGLCPEHRKRRQTGMIITTLLALAGGVGLVAGIQVAAESRSSDPPIGVLVVLAGIVLLIASVVTGTTMARVLSPKKMDDRYAWFRGAGNGYLRTLNTVP